MNKFLSRRSLFRHSSLAAAGSGLSYAAPAAKGKARNIIFMVSDGMSAGVLPLAELFSQLTRARGTHWHRLLQRKDVAHGLFDMASLNSPVTDSAAASSSWGSGVRIFNAAINTLPDGRKLTTLAELARDRGKKVGLVTTATVTHATPAGFAASQPRRDDEALIAPQYLNRVDIVLGGGTKFFDPSARPDKQNLWAEYQAKGYALARTRDELRTAPAGKLLGVFSPSHIPFCLDRRHNPELDQRTPPLAEMARAALDRLASHPQGFLLQIEGGRIDHAAHNNDAAAMLWEQLEFDDALGVALDFQQRQPNTLLVITTDHGNSNPGLNGTGKEYGGTSQAFARLREFRASFERTSPKLLGVADPQRVIEVVSEATGIRIETREAEAVIQCVAKHKNLDWNAQHDNPQGVMGQILGNRTGIGWTGTNHTADFTTLTALGPGAGDFAGLVRNTGAFERITHQLGVQFKNPEMPFEQAQALRASAPVVLPHWV
jgi:alkaline phosphatase